MEDTYRRVIIRSANDLPKKEGVYFAHNKLDKAKETIWHDDNSMMEWLETIDWYLQPIELPSDELIEKTAPYIADYKHIWVNFAKWMLSQIKGKDKI